MAADHNLSRREELADAVVRIGANRGLDRASVREVAAEAGVSIGAVQHHFHSKDEMLLFAYRRVIERTLARVERIDRRLGTRSVLQAILEEMLPLDEERTAEITALLAFAARATVVPQLAEVQAETLAQIRSDLGRLLTATRAEAGLVGRDAQKDALGLLALVDGLAFHAVSAPGQLSGEQLVTTLTSFLDELLASD